KASALLDRALTLRPDDSRARYFRSLVWRADGKAREAADELSSLAARYPQDREVQRQLGQTLYALGVLDRARQAMESILEIDPTDAGAYQMLSPIYLSEGQKREADNAHALYLLWRDDPRTDAIAARFFAAHPEWADERIGAHAHSDRSPQRAILAWPLAAPEK